MTSIQHASRPAAKLPPQASAGATASDIHTDPMRQELLLTQDRQDFALSIQALMSNSDDVHMLRDALLLRVKGFKECSGRPVQ
ncbi:hypothetical protein WJX82_007875 [Trebouxia sp. C0006]